MKKELQEKILHRLSSDWNLTFWMNH